MNAAPNATLTTTDPRTGRTEPTGIEATSAEQVKGIVDAAAGAFRALASMPRRDRAALLEAVAAALEASTDSLVETALTETGLAEARLRGEVARSAYQFRMFAEVVRDGAYLEAAIDHAGETPLGAQPDVRRMLVPLGPVAVFGSSNFPFAFSVPGGDTASALAAGCPVVVKAHSSHPLTSKRSFEVIEAALRAAGAPAGTIGIVYGTAAGAELVAQPEITAVGFTGSLGAAEALMEIIGRRPEPIPFYGELSSVNPLVISAAAAAARADAIAEGLVTSFTGSAGQLCTKPGLAFIPDGPEGDALVDAVLARAAAVAPQPLLNDRIARSLGEITHRLVGEGKATTLLQVPAGDGYAVGPTVLSIQAADVTDAVTEEAFGPVLVVVRYDDVGQLPRALAAVPKSLTATLHLEDADLLEFAGLLHDLESRSGRIVFNGYPTGVRVGWAQHHGGPWPSTNTLHTSVGATAIRRFLRPVAWQGAPQSALPAELRDDAADVVRRVDGKLVLPAG